MNSNWDVCKLPIAVALLVLIILTLMIGKKHGYTVDANASFVITHEIVSRGDWFPDTAVKQGYVYSVLFIPFYRLAAPLHVLLPDIPVEQIQRKMLCWMNTVFTACTAAVLCALLRTLGYPKPAQALLPLVYALTTLAFTYARYDYNKSVAAFFLLTAFYYMIRYLKNQQPVLSLFSGVSFALLLCIRFETAILALPFVTVLCIRKQIQAVACFLIPCAAGAALVLGYNAVYWQGDPAGGYAGTFTVNPFPAIAGVLFSPGKSLFLFNPVLLLLPLTVKHFWQNQPQSIRLVWVTSTGLLFLLYCFWGNWWGGWGYGARHFMPLIPLLLLPLAELFSQNGKALWLPFMLLSLLGAAVQFAGAAVAFHDVIHTLMQSGFTESQLIWEPQLNPVLQHVRFMRSLPFSHWDLAVIPYIQTIPVVFTLPILFLAFLGIGVITAWLYKNAAPKSIHEKSIQKDETAS